MKVDESVAREAVASLSEISVEVSATGSSGTVNYAVDFGDGTTSSGATARHTYSAAGSFTIRAEARDTSGRTAAATRDLVVTTLSGTLAHAGFNGRTGKMEVRSLVIGAQDGAVVRGLYRTTGAPDRAFVATLSAPRTLRIAVNGTNEAAEGTVPDRITEDGGLWPLLMRGDSVDGIRLDFRRAAGSPTGTAPDAVPILGFGGGAMPIVDFTAATFDGTRSKGSELSYFFEFGDGETATGSQLTHRLRRTGQLNASLTVVDKFGRSDTESVAYWSFSLGMWAPFDAWRGLTATHQLWLTFENRDGVNYRGRALYVPSGGGGPGVPFSATLSGANEIHISIPAQGVEFRGTVVMRGSFAHVMTLVQVGGANEGTIWTLGYDDGPG